MAAHSPRVVINAAAYTLVDQAEKEPELCNAVNATAVECLSDICTELDCTLVQISTDYVFGGPAQNEPHGELDATCAQGRYAQSKLAAERLAAGCRRHFIVRTCGLYGCRDPRGKGGNFVDTMLRLGAEREVVRVVSDQQCTPSYVPHVARAIAFLFSTDAYGVYHVVNAGATTWFEFAGEIFRQAGLKARIEPITAAEYGAPAPRPSYSVLSTAKYRALGGPELPNWSIALAEYLALRQNLANRS